MYKIKNIVPTITSVDGDILQEGKAYTGQQIIESGVIAEAEADGYIPWLMDGIGINPATLYTFWLDEGQMFYGVRKEVLTNEKL